MTEDQRKQIASLFDALFEMPKQERELALAAVEDAEVRAQVESLLRHTGQDSPELDLAIGQVMRAATEAGAIGGAGIGPGSIFDHYRLERLLGQGGMGEVWEATRSDDFHKRTSVERMPLSGAGIRGGFRDRCVLPWQEPRRDRQFPRS